MNAADKLMIAIGVCGFVAGILVLAAAWAVFGG